MRPARSLPLPIGLFLVLSSLVLSSCLDQYDPTRYNNQWRSEFRQSVQPSQKLTATGDIPSAGANQVDIEERFQTLCSSCHGPKGFGDGPGSVALNPKPRNFHDKAWQAATSDDRIIGVITNGGASVGLSAVMPPWGSTLAPEDVKKMVQKIRAFGKE